MRWLQLALNNNIQPGVRTPNSTMICHGAKGTNRLGHADGHALFGGCAPLLGTTAAHLSR